MGKLESIVSSGEITIKEKTELEDGIFEPPAKTSKICNDVIADPMTSSLDAKLKLSSLIATQIGHVKSPHLTKCGTPHQPGQLETVSTIYLLGLDILQTQKWHRKTTKISVSIYQFT